MRREREEVKNFGRRVHVISATVYLRSMVYGLSSVCGFQAEARCYDYCLPSTVYGLERAQAKARHYGTS